MAFQFPKPPTKNQFQSHPTGTKIVYKAHKEPSIMAEVFFWLYNGILLDPFIYQIAGLLQFWVQAREACI